MENKIISNDVFGFVKTKVDVHTMGIYTMANLLRDCGYKVVIAKDVFKSFSNASLKLFKYI